MKISDLAPQPKNPRKITDEKLAQLKKALLEFGDLSGIVFNRRTGHLVGGHQRTKHFNPKSDVFVTKKYGKPSKTGTTAIGYVLLAGERFSYREVDWGEPREKAANIAANKGAGEWDLPQLGEWMKELASFDIDFDLSLTMFDEEELKEFGVIKVKEHTRVGATGVDEDEVPERAPARARPGDVWILGKHRLVCGDSTLAQDVERLMKDVKADLVWTDPPYNVALGMETKEQAKARNRRTDGLVVMNDKMSDEDFRAFLHVVFVNAFNHVEAGGGIYIAHADSEGYNFRGAARDAGWAIKQCLIWKKSSLVMGRQDYHWIHEPILYGWKEGSAHNWYSDRKQTTVLEFAKPSRSEGHPTMKPVELVQYCLENSSQEDDVVLDLFGGSGTTMIACEKLGRSCRMMELDPHYIDVIVERWEKYTGKEAKLALRKADEKGKTAKPSKNRNAKDNEAPQATSV